MPPPPKSSSVASSGRPKSGNKKRGGSGKRGGKKRNDLDYDAITVNQNYIWDTLHKNRKNDLLEVLDDPYHPHHDLTFDNINARNEIGRTAIGFKNQLISAGVPSIPIDLSEDAIILGDRNEMILALLESEKYDVMAMNSINYSSLHFAAAYGRTEVVKSLVELGADLQQRTRENERAREIAARYDQRPCVEYLDWAEAKKFFLDAIDDMNALLADRERIEGRFTKEDKSYATSACKEKTDWFNNVANPTTSDFRLQKKDLDETLAPIYAKLEDIEEDLESSAAES